MDLELDENMKESFYFSHDYNSRADAKVKKLLAKHGMQGFGVFWAIVEDLYNNDNNLILDLESISYDLRVDEELIKSIINNFDLFILNDGILSSESIQKRLDKRNEKSLKASESAKLRWDKSERNANALPTNNDSNAIKDNKGKKRKEKYIAEEGVDYKLSKGKNGVFICEVLRQECINFFNENKNLYPDDMYREFIEYWSEEEKDKIPKWINIKIENSGKWSLPRRLSTWFKNYRPKVVSNQTPIINQSEIPERLRMQRI